MNPNWVIAISVWLIIPIFLLCADFEAFKCSLLTLIKDFHDLKKKIMILLELVLPIYTVFSLGARSQIILIPNYGLQNGWSISFSCCISGTGASRRAQNFKSFLLGQQGDQTSHIWIQYRATIICEIFLSTAKKINYILTLTKLSAKLPFVFGTIEPAGQC